MKSSLCLALGLLCLLGSGCAVRLSPVIPPGDGVSRGFLQLEHEVRDLPSTIGMSLLDLSEIEFADEEPATALMDVVGQTFESAGYRVLHPQDPRPAATVSCQVRHLEFGTRSWISPVAPTWGGIVVELRVVDFHGELRWEEQYIGKSWNFWYSIPSAFNRATSKLLAAIHEDIATEEFRQACCPPLPPPEPPADDEPEAPPAPQPVSDSISRAASS